MWRNILVIVAAFVSLSLVSPVNCQSNKAKQIDEFVDQFAKGGQFGGVVLASENGKVIYEKAFGLAIDLLRRTTSSGLRAMRLRLCSKNSIPSKIALVVS